MIDKGSAPVRHRPARIFDSNTLIYYLNGAYSPDQFARVDAWIEGGAAISIITRIEVLGFQQSEA